MTAANTSQDTVRRVHLELRTGDVLELPGVVIQMVEKSGQTARMVVCAAPEISFKKVPARTKPAIVKA
ncbi:hypothetical protein [Acidovorax sp. PRC11]|uniref:hypothetical protein n=1 Tax=Acidovorax sp. PRC11 TaxID=2962592 RepID=UPI002882B78C|nr:hypothetical protein [Acidovorax sp. PRC11]MDT0138100.1 hypothetical protein [Acidovorax sp. PRC11]